MMPEIEKYVKRTKNSKNVLPSWEMRRLKFSVTLRNEKIEAENSSLNYLGLEHIESWTGKLIPDESASSEGIATRFVKDDVLFGKLRPYLAKVYLAKQEGMATTEALVMTSEPVLVSAFLKYVLLSDKFIKAVNGSTYGAKMPRANWETIGRLPICFPSPKEQQQIANFLDWKTGQIDTLIAKKQALLEKLKEKRLAVITQAVTKGLNSDAPMRDSGIPWLGEVPEHWKVMRLKFTASKPLQYGANEAAELDDPECPRYIRITDIKEDGTLYEETFRSLLPDIAQSYLLEDGDLLLARSGATVGKSFQYLQTWGKAAYAGYLIRFRVNPAVLTARFAYYFLRSQFYWACINTSLIQATIQNFSAEKYANISVPLPPLKEQGLVVAGLEKLITKTDRLEDATTQAITRLTEYRTALITAATTGKIDVRGVKVPKSRHSEPGIAAAEPKA